MKTNTGIYCIFIFVLFILMTGNKTQAQYCGQCVGNTASGTKSTATGVGSVASGSQALASGRNATASGTTSFSLGTSTLASGNSAFAFGQNSTSEDAFTFSLGYFSHAMAARSYAIGNFATTSAGDCFAIGNYVHSYGSGSITLGSSMSGQELVNPYTNNLMVGFGVVPSIMVEEHSFKAGFVLSQPTFYVGPKSSTESTINVGIGTITPAQPLHVNGNFLVTGVNSSILISDQIPQAGVTGIADFGIEYLNQGLNIWKPWSPTNNGGNYYLFLKDNGNVGIGTGSPTSKLQVDGSTFLNGQLKVSSLATTSGTKMVIASADGSLSAVDIAGDNLGSHIATRNIQMIGNFITNDESTSTNEGIYIGPTGNVGIKTNNINDNDDLTVYSPSTKDASIRVKGTGTNASLFWASNGSKSFGIGVKAGECVFYEDNITNKIIRIAGGKVGIGVPDNISMPGNYLLYVKGGLYSEEIKVKLKENWSDFVFDNNYKLMSLTDLESYISTNKHLPNIPTEEELKKTGIDLVKTNALLLEKIEELSLYLIQQEKRIQQLEQKSN